MSKKVSVIIPSRKERWLQQTVNEVFTKAQGEVECIVCHDGAWPDEPLEDRKGLTQLFRTSDLGMRNSINAASRIATGGYLMKLDGHCLLGFGYDEILKINCEDDWIVVPRRYSLDADNWKIKEDKAPVDYHFLSWPFERPGDRTNGLHGNVWRERAKERSYVLIDDEMSSQGSCWFMSRKHWDRLGEMEVHHYGTFAQEAQELFNKTWLGGGRGVVNKKTFYAHLHKGKQHGTGYGFTNARWDAWAKEREAARVFTIDYWMNDRWQERVRDFRWLIEKFNPPGWPENWEEIAKEKIKELCHSQTMNMQAV